MVVQIYDNTYKNNARTISVDKEAVFELVATQAEADTTPIDYDPVSDVYVTAGLYSDNSIRLYRTDGAVVNIGIDEITNWHEGD